MVLKTAAFIKSNTYDVFYNENIFNKPLLQEKSHPKSLISAHIQMMQIGFTDLEKNTMCDMVVCTIVRRTSHQEPPPRVPTSRGANLWATPHSSSEYATSQTELRYIPHWATPHPALSYATPSTDLRHTPLLSRHIMNWATSHSAPSYATPSTELRHNSHWAASRPAYSWLHPALSYATPRTELSPSPHWVNFSPNLKKIALCLYGEYAKQRKKC